MCCSQHRIVSHKPRSRVRAQDPTGIMPAKKPCAPHVTASREAFPAKCVHVGLPFDDSLPFDLILRLARQRVIK